MCFREKIITLQRIDTHNDSYRITTEQQVDDLMCSIKHLGLLNLPLLLEKETEYYTVVSGFRRIEACRRLNWTELRARVFGSDTERLKCVKYAIADNAFQRPLNIIEKSKCIKMLSAFYKDFDSLAEALKAIGLSEHPAMLKKIKIVYDMSESLQNSVLSNTIPLAMALELNGLPMDDATGFISLFNALKLSLNKQREILMMVKEIAIREDMSVMQVLEAPYLKNLLINKDLDKNQKARKIRTYLKQRRYPAITSAEQSFQKHLKKLNTRKEIELIPPVNFEGSTYTLKLTFKNITDLKDIKSNFDAFVENPFLKKIIKD
jgi:ParB family chromosome partitioning protein